MISSRKYWREPAVESIGEIEDIEDKEERDAREVADSLNSIINLIKISTDLWKNNSCPNEAKTEYDEKITKMP